MGATLQEQQRGPHGERDRALQPWGGCGHLGLAQPCRPVHRLNEPVHRAPAPIPVDHRPSAHLGEMGQQNFWRFRPLVSPWCAQDAGASTQMPSAGPCGLSPRRATTPGLFAGNPPAALGLLRHGGHPSLARGSVRNAPGPGKSAHHAGPSLADPLAGGFGGPGGIADHDPHRRPVRPTQADQPPATQRLVGALRGLGCAAYALKLPGDAVVAPWPHAPHARQPNAIGRLLGEASWLGQRRRRAGVGFDGASDHQRAHALLRGRPRGDAVLHTPPPQDAPRPRGCGQEPTQRPRGHRARGPPRPALDGRLVRIAGWADQAPAEDQRMPMLKQWAEHGQPVRHWLGPPCAPQPGGSPPKRSR
jgi:hypothetical protein